MDNKANTLRAKILSKSTPRVMPNSKRKEIAKPVSVSIKKASPTPLSLLLAKSKNEVNTISKYFKGNKTTTNHSKPTKSYVQASRQIASTSDMLKIKESFPTLNTK